MRSVFVFPAIERDDALRRLVRAGVDVDLPVAVSPADRRVLIWATVVDRADVDFDLDEVDRAAGFRPTWGLEIAVSGHYPHGRVRELEELTASLLSDGGCATTIEDQVFLTAEEWRARVARTPVGEQR